MLELGNLMRGGCMTFALHLHRRSRLPLFGLFDESGRLHHAGVGEESASVLYDGRGPVPIDLFHFWRGIPCAGDRLEVISPDDVKAALAEDHLPVYSRQAMDAYMMRTGLFTQMPIMPLPSRGKAQPKVIPPALCPITPSL